MANKKNTRRALFTSIMSLILCCAMLVGTTFAWFTDRVASGNNIIKSGNLDVELYYQTEGQSDWTMVDANTNVFKNDTLWEPGHTEVVKLKVVNAGSLALKYQLGVNVSSETGSVNVGGTEFKLSDYIKFGIMNGSHSYTRDQAVAAVDATATALNVAYTSATTSLAAGAEQIVTMVVYMPTSVGNEANHAKGAAQPTINLGVILNATQQTNENDSFGSDYDEDATYADSTHQAGADKSLAEILAEVDASEDEIVLINLDANATWETGAEIGSTPWISETSTVKKLIVNGNGHTLTATGSGVGPIRMANGGTLVFKNITIKDESVSYAENNWEYGYLEFSGNLAFENVTCVNAIQLDDANATFKNCSFNSNADNEYAVWVCGNSASFSGCTFSGARGLKIHEAYSSEVATVTVDNCTFSNLTKKPGVAIGDLNAETSVTIQNSTFINCQAGDQNLYIYETDTDVTTFNFTETNNTVKTIEYINDGLTKEGNTYYVTSADGLTYLSAKELTGNNGTAESVIIELQNDIDMGGDSFSAMIAQRGDALTFNGNNHTISNVNIVSGNNDNSTGSAAMFYCYPNSTLNVSDLKLENLTVTTDEDSSGYGAAVVGYCEGATTLYNVDVINATINGVKSSGMLAGHVGNGGTLTATNCDVSGSVTLKEYENGGHYAAKYVGTAAGPIVLNGCTANVTVGGNLHSNNDGNVYGRIASGGAVTVDGVALKTASSQDALDNAFNTNSNTSITLSAGEYTMPSTSNNGTITITGTKDTVIDNTMGAYMENATVSFEGVTIKGSTGMANGNGADYAALYTPNVTYTNCTFDGPFRIGRDGATFINCTFTNLGNDYIWTYGNDATFKNCSFETDGKALLIYSDGGNEVSKVVVENCTFNATAGAKAGAIANQNCAAIEIHNYGNGVDLTTSGNSYGSNFSGEWRIKTYETGKPKVFVNGTEYTTIAIDGKTMTIDIDKNVTVNG